MRNRSRARGSGRGYRERLQNMQDFRQRFLILCDGSKTEPSYFGAFRVSATIDGLALDPPKLVKEAIRRRDIAQQAHEPYDQVWCVFDRDEWELEDFNLAIAMGKQHSIGIAYSNEAFELWYLLHFDYCDTACHRSEFQERLTHKLRFKYLKNHASMHNILVQKQPLAIRNAAKLLTQFDPSDPAAANPSTTVHLLVEALNRSSRP